MPDQQRVVVLAPTLMDRLLEPIERELRGRGLVVTRFIDGAALIADTDALATADVLLADGRVPVTRGMLSRAPRLRAVVSPWTGIEGYDEAAATELGIVIANGQPPENYLSMAEATVLLILAALYDMRGSEMLLRENRRRPPTPAARMLRHKTVGLIGFGQIARAVAARLVGWDVAIQVYAPRIAGALPPDIAHVDLDTLLQTSDIREHPHESECDIEGVAGGQAAAVDEA